MFYRIKELEWELLVGNSAALFRCLTPSCSYYIYKIDGEFELSVSTLRTKTDIEAESVEDAKQKAREHYLELIGAKEVVGITVCNGEIEEIEVDDELD